MTWLKKLEHDLYIIPSSTDECIALCDSPSLNIDHVKEMLRSVNKSEMVDPDKSYRIICIITIKMNTF